MINLIELTMMLVISVIVYTTILCNGGVLLKKLGFFDIRRNEFKNITSFAFVIIISLTTILYLLKIFIK